MSTAPTSNMAVRPAAANPIQAADLLQLPPWLQSLRKSMENAIGENDLKEVMEAQMKKAKGGDVRAASFVFEQAHKMMQAETGRKITVVQNNETHTHNYYEPPVRADAPIKPGATPDQEIGTLRARARAGLPLTGNPEDRRARTYTDDEERELRRQEDQAEAERIASERGPEAD